MIKCATVTRHTACIHCRHHLVRDRGNIYLLGLIYIKDGLGMQHKHVNRSLAARRCKNRPRCPEPMLVIPLKMHYHTHQCHHPHPAVTQPYCYHPTHSHASSATSRLESKPHPGNHLKQVSPTNHSPSTYQANGQAPTPGHPELREAQRPNCPREIPHICACTLFVTLGRPLSFRLN